MKRFFLKPLLFFLFLVVLSMDNDPTCKHLFTIVAKSDFVTTDHLGNIYLVKHDELIKYNSAGEKLKMYSNKKLGKIYSVDASNPLRVLLFYRDFSIVVVLDSQLSPNGEGIPLEEMNLEQADQVCTSFNNGIWIFNRQNMELIRLDESMTKVVTTGNLNRLLNLDLHPNFLMEYNGLVYLNDPSEGVLVFDIYGTYAKTIPLYHLTSFQFRESVLYYFSERKFTAYHTRELWKHPLQFSDSTTRQIRIEKNRLYISYSDSVSVCWSGKP